MRQKCSQPTQYVMPADFPCGDLEPDLKLLSKNRFQICCGCDLARQNSTRLEGKKKGNVFMRLGMGKGDTMRMHAADCEGKNGLLWNENTSASVDTTKRVTRHTTQCRSSCTPVSSQGFVCITREREHGKKMGTDLSQERAHPSLKFRAACVQPH